MSNLVQDLKFALRMAAKQPGYCLIVVAMLALGIAGTTAIFSVFNGLFLRPLPFAEPERLADLDEQAPRWNLEFVSIAYPDFAAWREQSRAFDGMAVWRDESFNLSSRNAAERIDGARVTYDLLSVLRLKPALGRAILPEDDRPGGAKVALIGYGLWQRMFGGRPDALGQTLRLNSESYSIVGVLPPEGVFPGRAELWVPLAESLEAKGRGWYLKGIGRLKPGITLAQARDDLMRVHKGMIPSRQANEITSPRIMPVRERYLGNFRLATFVLLGAVAIVLIIACVNIAGLMLARGAARSREMGIRAALGASRARIVSQLLSESLLLVAIGGVLGAALGVAALKALISLMPDQLPRWVSFRLDLRSLAFCTTISGAAAILFGLWPALEGARTDVRGSLQDSSSRSTASAARRRSLSVLVVGEVALAVVLLVGAGLLVQAFRKLQQVDPGFRADNVLLYQVALPDAKYQKNDRRVVFFDRLIEQNRALPGVRAAAAVTAPPLALNEQDPVVLQRVASAGYIEAMGITLLAGRSFAEADGRSDASRVIIVNEIFAKRYWPNTDPVGKRMRYRGSKDWMTVVGVVHDVKHYGLDQEMRPGVYVPLPQNAVSGMTMVLRTAVDPLSLVAPAREGLRGLDPELPMYQITTMTQQVRESLWVRRAYSSLLGIFAAVALLLSVAGIYGVISYTVSRRTHEIGIRMALGAQQGQVLRHVLSQGMRLAITGLALGLAAAFWTARLMQSLLFGVSASDPVTYAAVTAGLLAVALLANLFPARRAASIDPMTALRVE